MNNIILRSGLVVGVESVPHISKYNEKFKKFPPKFTNEKESKHYNI